MKPPLSIYRSRPHPDWTEGAVIEYEGQRYVVHIQRLTVRGRVTYTLTPVKETPPC